MPRALKSLLLAALVAAPPRIAGAQHAAPALVDEDLPAEEERSPPSAAEVERDPERGRGPTSTATPTATSTSTATATPTSTSTATSTSTSTSTDAAVPVRPIEPVRARHADLLAAWQERREALREGRVSAARAAEERLLDVRRELGVGNVEALAAAEIRAAGVALEARLPAEALARAELAVALAPDLPGAHLELARARLAREPGRPEQALAALLAAAAAAARDPLSRRAVLGGLAVAGAAAVLAAAALVVVVLFLRRSRLLLHDARHLPLLRHATPLQAGFCALALLLFPAALGAGPLPVLALLALAAAPYLARAERGVASAALLALALLPGAVRGVARHTTWSGTLADEVYALEHGADDGRLAGRLAARAARGELPPAGLLALGHHHKRRGALDEALAAYRAAGSARPEALVGIGNVQLLRGDAEAAKRSYLAAIDRAQATGDLPALAAAQYDLSKIFLRQSALDQAQEARRKAAAADAELVERAGSDDDFRANRFLIDAPVPPSEIRALAADELPRDVEAAVQARLAPPLPAAGWPWVPLLLAAAPWGAALLARRPGVSRTCDRCGRSACRRCDGVAGALCGQCENVYVKRDVVDARDRLRKERQVRRRARARRWAVRALGLVGGGAGHLWRGDAVRGALLSLVLLFLAVAAWVAQGMVPPPYAAWDRAARAAVAGLALVVWAGAVRDLFRRTRG